MIACVLMPDIVSVVEKQNIHLVLTNASGKVQAATRGAVQLGVRYGMRVHQVQLLCPDAHIQAFAETRYLELIEGITETLTQFTTRIELLSGFWDTDKKARKDAAVLHPSAAIYYLDLGKLAPKDALILAGKIDQLLQTEFAVSCSIGLAKNKFVASVAARYAELGQAKLVRLGEEANFLAGFSVSVLPLGKELERRLYLLGMKTLGELASLPVGSVTAQFGKHGRFLHQLAQGIDVRYVIAQPKKPSYHLTKQFDGAVQNRLIIESLLQQMGCEIESYLAQSGYTTQFLELWLHDDNLAVHKHSQVLREPIQNGKVIGRALLRLYQRSQLESVVSIEVLAKELTPVVYQQLELFGAPAVENNHLSDLLENLTARFGCESLYCVERDKPEHLFLEYRFTIQPMGVA